MGVVPTSALLQLLSLVQVLLVVVLVGTGAWLVLCWLGQVAHIHVLLLVHVLAFHGQFAGYTQLGDAAVEVAAACCKVLPLVWLSAWSVAAWGTLAPCAHSPWHAAVPLVVPLGLLWVACAVASTFLGGLACLARYGPWAG